MFGNMFGGYQHSLDVKGRVNFPVKLREELGELFYVTKGLDGCLFVYSQEGWAALAERIHSLPMSRARDIQRFFFGGAAEVEPDKQGRIMIPAHLRTFAGLSKDIMIAGTEDRVEIWDKQKWDERMNGLTDDVIAEAVDLAGF